MATFPLMATSAIQLADALAGLPSWAIALGGVLVGLLLLGLYAAGAQRKLVQARRHQVLFAGSPEGLVLTDPQWKIVEANDAACRFFDLPARQITLHTLDRLLRTEPPLNPEKLQGAFDDQDVMHYEASMERPDHARLDFAASTRRLHLGEQTYLLTALHDITRQKQDARLFKSFHDSLVEHIPIEVGVLNMQGQYLYVNKAAAGSLPVRDALIGSTDIEFCSEIGYHPEIALRRRSHRRHAVDTKVVTAFEEILPTRDGQQRHITRIYNPILNADGDVSAVVTYGVEQTDLKHHQDQMREVLEEAERISNLKDTFLTNISHEFRTPLTGIMGAAQVLEHELGTEHEEFVNIITRNSRRLMTTLNAMVDLARLHSEYVQMNPQVLNLVDEVKEVGRSLATDAKDKGLFLRMRATKPEFLIRADRSFLFRTLENLIGNAVKFTEQGGVLVEVAGENGKVHIRVMDTGVGMRREFLPFLFEEFNQESHGPMRDFEGVGIGMAVTKRLLDLMQGNITVSSEKGEGSMFTITLPAAFPHSVQNGQNGQNGHHGPRPRVLLADNDEQTHQLIKQVLQPYVDVDCVQRLDVALEEASRHRYDAVLLDVEIDGVPAAADALMPLRELPGYRKVPVVALDPHLLPGGDMQFLADGFDDCLHKPLERQQILDVLGTVLAADRPKKRDVAHLAETTA